MNNPLSLWVTALSVFAFCTAHTMAVTPCPGNGTNSHVVTEYLFFEGSGDDVVNTGTDEDAGNASLTNSAAFSADTPPSNLSCGWSLHLPNTGSGANTPALESDVDYDPLAGVEAFTIMAWVKRESAGANNNTSARIVSDTSSTSLGETTAGFEFRLVGSAGTLALRVNGYERSTTVGGIAPNSNTWQHVAVVYDGTRPATNTLTRNVHFYVDGIQRGDGSTLQNETVGANSNRLTVGNSSVSRGVGNLMVGKMDDVLILRDYAPDAVGNGATNETIVCFMNRNDDIEPPIIEAPSDVVEDNDAGQCYASNVSLGSPFVDDNCGVALVTNNAPAQFQVGITYILWTAVDYAGNAASSTQTVTIVDTEAPAITCPPDLELTAGPCLAPVPSAEVDLGEPVVSDNCSIAGVVSAVPEYFQVGITSVVWRVWDHAGNTNSCEQIITVEPSRVADCDGDGLTDWEEVMMYGSDYDNPDTSGDGYSDGWAVQYGFDPTNQIPESCRPKYW